MRIRAGVNLGRVGPFYAYMPLGQIGGRRGGSRQGMTWKQRQAADRALIDEIIRTREAADAAIARLERATERVEASHRRLQEIIDAQ